jgi:hypothetical protein
MSGLRSRGRSSNAQVVGVEEERARPGAHQHNEEEDPLALSDRPRVRRSGSRSQADKVKADISLTRTTVNLPVDLWDEFGDRARRRGISKSEALRRALWLYNLVDSRLASECDFIVVWPDGDEETIKLSPY